MSELTVGDLKRHLEDLADEARLSFAGGLTFYRLKRCADNDFFVEFNQPEAMLSPAFKRRNPDIKVAFVDTDNVEWDPPGVIGGPIDIEAR